MTPTDHSPHVLRVADLSQRTQTDVTVVPSIAEMSELQSALDVSDLRKVRFEGRLAPLGKSDWQLTAHLGATVVQPCVATLEPVTSRIETEVTRLFVRDYEMPDAPEAEMPEDETIEPLGTHIDLLHVLTEALSLALPLYPRAPSAEDPVAVSITEPGQRAMTDDDAKPFAGLAALKAKLADPGAQD